MSTQGSPIIDTNFTTESVLIKTTEARLDPYQAATALPKVFVVELEPVPAVLVAFEVCSVASMWRRRPYTAGVDSAFDSDFGCAAFRQVRLQSRDGSPPPPSSPSFVPGRCTTAFFPPALPAWALPSATR
jgi:hypothetical protein